MSVQLLGRLNNGYQLTLPLFLEGQSASDAENDLKYVDLAQLCATHKDRSLAVIQQSDAMQGIGIRTGDILIVDQSAPASQNDIVLVNFQGDLMIRTLELLPTPRLLAAHPEYNILVIPEDGELEILGTVSHCIHSVSN
ncbi:MAG: hypothetical protein LAT65_18490 [Saccharospirillum sp.]|nr:hypothetical protein [Saccharospirillum sp.]